MKRVAFFDSPRFDWHEGTAHHPESPARLFAIREELAKKSWAGQLLRPQFEAVDPSLLAEVHSATYLGGLERLAAFGGGRLDADTYVTAHSFEVAGFAAGAVERAVQLVAAGSVDRAFCAVRPSGHHATRDRGMGFCLLNNVVLGACAALRQNGIERVAIFDWDAHHGNGTEALTRDRADIYYVSTHQHPAFPYTGEIAERGKGAAAGTNLNVPLAPGAGDREVLSAWDQEIEPALSVYSPDMILISAGFDADIRDPLAELCMTSSGYRALTERVVNFAERVCQGRIVSVLEGGYDALALAEDVCIHLEALL